MPLFLIGYMASGKTTFGSALAKKLKLPFIDLDEYIEGSLGFSISEIFKEKGEPGFREIERKMLQEVAAHENAIIACGGGTPCFFDNLMLMKSKGKTVYLKSSVDVLTSRLEASNSKRPLMAGKNRKEIETTIKRQLEVREPYYNNADIIWDSDKLESEEEIESNISDFIAAYPFVFSTPFI